MKTLVVIVMLCSIAFCSNYSWFNESYECRAKLNTSEANSITWLQEQSINITYLTQKCGLNGSFGNGSIKIIYQNLTDAKEIPINYSGNETKMDIFYYSNVSSQQNKSIIKEKSRFHPNEYFGACWVGSPIDAVDGEIGDTNTFCGIINSSNNNVYLNTNEYSVKPNLVNITIYLIWRGSMSDNNLMIYMLNSSNEYEKIFTGIRQEDEGIRYINITITENPNRFNVNTTFNFVANVLNDNGGIYDLSIGYYYNSYNTTGENDAYFMYFSNESMNATNYTFNIPIQEKGIFSPKDCLGIECNFSIDNDWETAQYPDDWFISENGSITEYITEITIIAKIFSEGGETIISIYDKWGDGRYITSFFQGCLNPPQTQTVSGNICKNRNCSIDLNPNDFLMEGTILTEAFVIFHELPCNKAGLYEMVYNYKYYILEVFSDIDYLEKKPLPPPEPEPDRFY